MLNNVVLIGRLVRDPELRYTPAGVAVTQFTLAVDRPSQAKVASVKQTSFLLLLGDN